jgi:hypothetical protein
MSGFAPFRYGHYVPPVSRPMAYREIEFGQRSTRKTPLPYNRDTHIGQIYADRGSANVAD